MGRIYQHSRRKSAGIGIHWLLLTAAVALSARGGGDGPSNRASTANAGADQSGAELTVVNLGGSGSDPDAGSTLTFPGLRPPVSPSPSTTPIWQRPTLWRPMWQPALRRCSR